MDEYDDFFDDIDINEDVLAVINQEETKFANTQAPAPTPVTKKQKTGKGWCPGPGSQSQDADHIDIIFDGSGYALDTSKGAKRSRDIPQAVGSSSSRAQPAPAPQPPPTQGLSQASGSQTSRTSVERRNRLLQAIARGPSLPQIPPTTGVPSSSVVEDVAALHRQIAQLRQENERIQASLREAAQGKMSKEGEVSILRQNIDRIRLEHNQNISRLKASKEEADAKQALAQREMKQEIERLKTQFTFKQHELEASVRRAPKSVSRRALARGVPDTPIRTPNEMLAWSRGSQAADSQKRQGSFSTQQNSPEISRTKRPGSVAPKPSLPGFQDAFTASRSPSRRKGKDKQRNDDSSFILDTPSHRQKHVERSDNWLPASPNPFKTHTSQIPPDIGPSQWTAPVNQSGRSPPHDADESMVNDIFDMSVDWDEEESASPIEESNFDPSTAATLDLHNYKHQMLQSIFSHVFPASNTVPTIQTLMNAQDLMLPDVAPSYSQACTRTLEALATVTSPMQLGPAVRLVCGALTELLWYLSYVAEDTTTMPALLNLLTLLTRSLPGFSVAVLSPSLHEDVPPCTELLSTIIRTRLAYNLSSEAYFKPLAEQALGLLESLVWDTPEDYEEALASLLEKEDLLWTLIDRRQPTWFLASTCQIVLWLATYPAVAELLLAQSRPPVNPRDPYTDVECSAPYVERLCSFLNDINHVGQIEMQRSIVSLVSLLSIAQPEWHELLVQSPVLIPSLIAFLGDLVAPIWEDDIVVSQSDEHAERHVRLLNQTLYSVHHLITSRNPPVKLRDKLTQVKDLKCFHGASTHIFTLALGRLSYADPPDWVPPASQAELSMMSEIAQDVLGFIIEGPEADDISDAFESEIYEDSELDAFTFDYDRMDVDPR